MVVLLFCLFGSLWVLFRGEGSVFNTPLCFISFYFLSGFGRAKGTINVKLFEVLTERI